MKKIKINYILISSICVLIGITIIFIINYNVKLEGLNCSGLNCSEYIDVSNEKMASYDNLYGASCYAECLQNTIPNKCNYALISGDIYKPGTCKLYNTINNATNSPNNNLYYMQNIELQQLPYVNQSNKGYNSNVIPIKTINDVHKLTCDYECYINPACSSYTTSLADDSLNAGTCQFYSGSNTNNITDMPGTTIHAKNITIR
jgi:hypothetical protein